MTFRVKERPKFPVGPTGSLGKAPLLVRGFSWRKPTQKIDFPYWMMRVDGVWGTRSLEINAIWTFDTEFPTIFNKSCTYLTFKSAVKHRQLGYGYPRGHTVHLAEATTQDTYSSI